MPPRVATYYFAVNSPWSLLGAPRLKEIAARTGAEVDVCPVDVMRVFRETGSQPLSQRPKARQDYRLWEIRRWSARLGVPILPLPDAFPFDETLAAACLLALKARGGDALGLSITLGRALWVDNRNPAARAVVAEAIAAAGENAEDLLADAEGRAADWEEERQRLSDAAIAAGAFGVPFYFVGEEPFWGQDRLDFVEEALA